MSSEIDYTSNSHVNPNIFQLENKPKHILCHEIGAGSPCLKCDCPGLDLHYWRMDDHDLILPKNMDHGQIVIGRLFDFIPEFENKLRISVSAAEPLLENTVKSSASKCPNLKSRPNSMYNVMLENLREKNKAVTEYTWVPTSNRLLAEKYFNALPENERPIAGTEGASDRRHKLQFQLPNHDSDASAAKSLSSDTDKKQHAKYVSVVKDKVVGVGKLVEFDVIHSPTDNLSSKSTPRTEAEKKFGYQKCQTCQQQLKLGEIAIVTDHGAPDEMWHVSCFRCHTCNQRLVDLLYFYKDGIYYCGRHFGDSLYPRCSGCDELIFSKAYTFAEEKSWHLDHFCCFDCDLVLGGHRYMMKDEQPFCFTCYMIKYAKTCRSCLKKIAPDQQRISYKNLHWHANEVCFKCQQCSGILLGKKFIVKNELVFCSSECKKLFSK